MATLTRQPHEGGATGRTPSYNVSPRARDPQAAIAAFLGSRPVATTQAPAPGHNHAARRHRTAGLRLTMHGSPATGPFSTRGPVRRGPPEKQGAWRPVRRALETASPRSVKRCQAGDCNTLCELTLGPGDRKMVCEGSGPCARRAAWVCVIAGFPVQKGADYSNHA